MAITALDKCDQKSIKSQALSSVHTLSDTNQSNLWKIDFGPEDLITTASKLSKLKKNKELQSPYVLGDKLQMVSRITERKIIHKRGGDFKSSFPLASNIYKASSDEFKALKRGSNRKNKKSVLTLPNEPAPMPQTCTVSDVNEADYLERSNDDRNVPPEKQVTNQSHKRYRKSYQYDYYDKDIRHIDMECSSTDMFKRYDGDGRKVTGKDRKSNNKEDLKGNDVWTVLRNINRFQFRPSPRISEESLVVKKKKGKKRVYCKDRRLISETRRTEEIAYIADFEVSSKSPTSSTGRLTVIVNSDSKKQLQSNNKLSNLLYRSLTTRQKINNRTNDYVQNKNNLFPSIKDKVMNSTKNRDKEHTLNLNKYRNSDNSFKISIDSSNHKSLLKQNVSGERFCENSDTNEMPGNLIVTRNCKQVRSRYAPDSKFYDNARNNITSGSQKSNQNDTKSYRKPRLVTTMPSQNPTLKITSADIKRRLTHMKFPLVILGKDQFSSTLEAMDDYPNQFEGLEKNVWPFMLEWNKDQKPKRNILKKTDDKTTKKNDINTKPQNGKSIKEMFVIKRKADTKPTVYNTVKEKPSTLSKKMLNIIFKKSKYDFTEINNDRNDENYIQTKNESNTTLKNLCITLAEASTETNEDRGFIVNDKRIKKTKPTQPLGPKGRWSSEYIENVISKIKNGSYYSLESSIDKAITRMEMAVQTPNFASKRPNLSQKIIARDILTDSEIDKDTVKPIPGFDHAIPSVEVKTLNFNQISVKHCMTNVLLQFDVCISDKINAATGFKNIVDSSEPFEVIANGQFKVFKYKTTIVNAILPAEICSVLPKLMRTFIDTNAYLNTSCKKNLTILPAITQPTLPEPVSKYGPEILPICTSSALRQIASGTFSVITKVSNAILVKKAVHPFSGIITNGLLRKPDLMVSFNRICDHINLILPKEAIEPKCQKKTQSHCLALLPYYTFTHGKIIPAYKKLNFFDIFKNMITCCSVLFENTTITITRHNKELYFTCDMKDSVENVVASGTEIHKKIMTVTISKVKTDSLFNGFLKKSVHNDVKLNRLESSSKIVNVGEHYSKRNSRMQTNNKARRVGFVKLYKRCKSTSSISGENSCTSLSKIMNLNDFFQVLGSGKSLSSVFDGCAERKLMTSIVDMKSWISEITPRQALLVLLLTNKKDTPNLTRFRPILLQGIAVNRITRASELDMEIEVIERENFNSLSQTYDIPYLPADVVNHNNLFEEMCWIAKTTASDYQKPFDESSEKLLKSLLEKRKKLNPSYLRVMARYVGLGLLKPAKNKS